MQKKIGTKIRDFTSLSPDLTKRNITTLTLNNNNKTPKSCTVPITGPCPSSVVLRCPSTTDRHLASTQSAKKQPKPKRPAVASSLSLSLSSNVQISCCQLHTGGLDPLNFPHHSAEVGRLTESRKIRRAKGHAGKRRTRHARTGSGAPTPQLISRLWERVRRATVC